MNEIVYRIGDRYRNPMTHVDFQIEIVALDGRYPHRLVVNSNNLHDYKVGMLGDWGISNWIYLGNFSKNGNFETLYEKLL